MAGDRGDRDGGRSLRREAKTALARWVVHKRRSLGDPERDRPRDSDEATHAWDGRRRFAEDYTFAAVDPTLAVLVRLESLPGRAAHRLWVIVFGEHGTFMLPHVDQLITRRSADHWRVGGVELDCMAPFRRWSIQCRNKLVRVDAGALAVPVPCVLELEHSCSDAPFVPGVDDDPELVAARLGEAHWDADLVRSVRRATQRGYVQLGRMTGTIRIGDHSLAVSAPAMRQHTWGVRDWGAAGHASQWFVHRAERAAWVQHAVFPTFTLEGGFVRDHESRAPVRTLELADHAIALTTSQASLRFQGNAIATVELRVDGRGALALSWLRDEDGGAALVAAQRRTLPRPSPRP